MIHLIDGFCLRIRCKGRGFTVVNPHFGASARLFGEARGFADAKPLRGASSREI